MTVVTVVEMFRAQEKRKKFRAAKKILDTLPGPWAECRRVNEIVQKKASASESQTRLRSHDTELRNKRPASDNAGKSKKKKRRLLGKRPDAQVGGGMEQNARPKKATTFSFKPRSKTSGPLAPTHKKIHTPTSSRKSSHNPHNSSRQSIPQSFNRTTPSRNPAVRPKAKVKWFKRTETALRHTDHHYGAEIREPNGKEVGSVVMRKLSNRCWEFELQSNLDTIEVNFGEDYLQLKIARKKQDAITISFLHWCRKVRLLMTKK